MSVTWRLAAVVLCLGLAPAQAPLPAGTYAIDEAPPAWQEAIARADLVIVSMQDALLRELTGALAAGGPVAAVQSCHVDVTGIVQRLQRREGIEAGRTSHRLRNPANAPRPWAAPLVAAQAGQRARDVRGFVVDLDARVGVLRPIAERALCASCHGTERDRPAEVRTAIEARYPDDRATGFRDGDVRGWFWVEIPKGDH